MSDEALRVAIVGAESTGKSTLVQALAERLREEFALVAAPVPELLRDWCEREQRTPRMDEQVAIAHAQAQAIDEAARRADVVLCDTTPLMTSVYSEMLFDDRAIDPFARATHERIDLVLLTALDIPWVPDGLQRDGPQVREPVDRHVRRRLVEWGVEWTVVSGEGPSRVEHALDAMRPALARWVERRGERGDRDAGGLFTGLLGARTGPARPMPRCERCDVAGCEHLAGARPAVTTR